LHASCAEDTGSYSGVAVEDLEQSDEGKDVGDESDDL
jgi:hypothetical protein